MSEVQQETGRQQAELLGLVVELSEHLDRVCIELEACEEEVRRLREEIRISERPRYLRRFWNWCCRTGRRILGWCSGNEMA